MGKVTWGPNLLEVDETVGGHAMVPPVSPGGDGSIFVSMVSYRDGERCAETLKFLFENAKNPDKILVGLVEQNAPEDVYCIDHYCKLYGVETIKKDPIRDDTVKIVLQEDAYPKCPHVNQVRLLAFHQWGAKGPIYARSLQRKNLGNQEFCLQIDAHSNFAKHWDAGLLEQWRAAQNEFGVISTVPPDKAEQTALQPGGAQQTKVPRQCMVKFRDNGVPDYGSPADAFVEGLTKPLLSHAWSAAFSFAKCHLEETVPYDPFSYYAMPIEQFTRYARMWTRGYDTYTPTRNYVFHDYGPQANGHGDLEWFKKHQKNRFRKMAVDRAKLLLEMPGLSEASDTIEADRANLGIYGLGQRRSLEQLQQFADIKLLEKQGNVLEKQGKCVGHTLVPYEAKISPLANLHHDGATRLDPNPIFPLRTELTFSTVDVTTGEAAKHRKERLDTDHLVIEVQENGGQNAAGPEGGVRGPNVEVLHRHAALGPDMVEQVNLPPTSVLFVLWFFGLVVWCFVFAVPNTSNEKSWLSKQAKSSVKRKTKIVKDI